MNKVSMLLSRSFLLVGIIFALAMPAIAEDTDMIVDGKPVPSGVYQWQVRLYDSEEDQFGFCGGSIIGSKWILTAAHCTYDANGDPVDKIVVGYGSNDRTKTKKIESETIIRHPDYAQGKKADLALIKLKSAIPNAPWIGIADAGVDEEMLQPGSRVTVTGWGAMWDPGDEAMHQLLAILASESGSNPVNFARALRQNRSISDKVNFPLKLHEVDIQIIDQQACQEMFSEIGLDVDKTEICAMEPGTRKDSCNGDSGGPLIVPADNRNGYVQVGVVSWGKECGDKTYPGVYARLSSFNDWIRSNMQPQ
jgi:secreted trypsin-like serine protease